MFRERLPRVISPLEGENGSSRLASAGASKSMAIQEGGEWPRDTPLPKTASPTLAVFDLPSRGRFSPSQSLARA